jgi:hypothetical protein
MGCLATIIFAAMARDAGLELVVNNSQFQGTPDDPVFRDLQNALSLISESAASAG